MLGIKNILLKSGVDFGAFITIAPMVDAVDSAIVNQLVIAGVIVVVNTLLMPLYQLLIEWIKYKLKKALPEELHENIDKIGKKQEKK
jgi:hypothetical protein